MKPVALTGNVIKNRQAKNDTGNNGHKAQIEDKKRTEAKTKPKNTRKMSTTDLTKIR